MLFVYKHFISESDCCEHLTNHKPLSNLPATCKPWLTTWFRCEPNKYKRWRKLDYLNQIEKENLLNIFWKMIRCLLFWLPFLGFWTWTHISFEKVTMYTQLQKLNQHQKKRLLTSRALPLNIINPPTFSNNFLWGQVTVRCSVWSWLFLTKDLAPYRGGFPQPQPQAQAQLPRHMSPGPLQNIPWQLARHPGYLPYSNRTAQNWRLMSFPMNIHGGRKLVKNAIKNAASKEAEEWCSKSLRWAHDLNYTEVWLYGGGVCPAWDMTAVKLKSSAQQRVWLNFETQIIQICCCFPISYNLPGLISRRRSNISTQLLFLNQVTWALLASFNCANSTCSTVSMQTSKKQLFFYRNFCVGYEIRQGFSWQNDAI